MMNYLFGGLLLSALLAGGFATVQTKRLEAAQSRVVMTQGELSTCAGRLGAILRDVRSDNAIDDLNLRDFVIPDGWLRKGPSGH